MSEFKAGDKVKCIKAGCFLQPKVGEIYTVESVSPIGTLRLIGVSKYWNADKFELYKRYGVEDIKEAMKVFEKFNITRSPDGLYSYGDSGIKCTTAEEFFIINSLTTGIKELHKSGDDINQGLRKVLDEVLSGKV